MELTHSALVKAATKWALRTCPIVISELATSGEEPDVLGWQSSGVSILLECKASRSDFKRDADKKYRRTPERGVGQVRYYFTPKGLLKIEEIPCGWGLLEFDGRRYFRTKDSDPHKAFETHEKTILISVIRRIGQSKPQGVSISPYYYTTLGRAELHLEIEEPQEDGWIAKADKEPPTETRLWLWASGAEQPISINDIKMSGYSIQRAFGSLGYTHWKFAEPFPKPPTEVKE